MPDAWDTYIRRQQDEAPPPPAPFNPFTSVLGRLFGNLGGGQQPGQLSADKRGLFTPSMLPMPVGPATPVDYGRMRHLLNSGVLQTGQIQPYVPPAPEPEAVPPPAPRRSGLLSFLFGGGQ